jgi:hypothetical protein
MAMESDSLGPVQGCQTQPVRMSIEVVFRNNN